MHKDGQGSRVQAMRFRDHMSAKAITLCFAGIGMVLMAVFLVTAEVQLNMVMLFELAAALIILGCLLCGWLLDRRRIAKLERLVDEMEDKYLIGELLPRPANAVERVYFEAMKVISRAAIDRVESVQREKSGYQDYLESWVHELKTPLTACSLILGNDGDRRKIRREIKRMDNLTESILYFGRMRTLENDVHIREVEVSDVAGDAVKSQMEILTASRISVDITGGFRAFTDDKSLMFMLKQLLINCSKYCPGCHITVKAVDGVLSVRDNGPGIPSHEIDRVCQRGFSGSAARGTGRSTGMGLYIVKSLCDTLGIGFDIESVYGEYTEASFTFQQWDDSDSLCRHE